MIGIFVTHQLNFGGTSRVAVIFYNSGGDLTGNVPVTGVLFPASIVNVVILPLVVFRRVRLVIYTILTHQCGHRARRLRTRRRDDTSGTWDKHFEN